MAFKRQRTPYAWFGRKRLSFNRMALVTVGSAALSALLFLLVTTVWFPIRLQLTVPGTQTGVTITTGFAKDKILLIMGVDTNYQNTDKDNDQKGSRSDTMMLVRLRPSDNTLSLVSIPRDSRVYLGDTQHIDKINSAHAEGGPEMAVRTVEQSFGIPIDHYLVINFGGVRDLVDAIGGVDLFVEKAMDYEDHTAKLSIHLQPGLNHLDGKGAEGFLRFRHDALADIGRIRRQQQFIAAVSSKMKNPLILASLPRLVQVGVQYLKTNMSFNEVMKLAVFVKGVDMQNIRSTTMPGTPKTLHGISYWVVNRQAAASTLDRVILDQELNVQDPTQPIKVGILYPATQLLQYEALKQRLTDAGYNVVCHGVQNKGATLLLEQTERATTKQTQLLRQVDPVLQHARLLFAPPESTFATSYCGGQEDYTITLGAESNP
jgi:polyisoprenyl-teichoic acid--peptidoglycan teichoic acid transferase